MKNEKLSVKDDINFLEYPDWVVDERKGAKTYVIEKNNGKYNGKYIISTTENIDRLPDRTDKILLYYLL